MWVIRHESRWQREVGTRQCRTSEVALISLVFILRTKEAIEVPPSRFVWDVCSRYVARKGHVTAL